MTIARRGFWFGAALSLLLCSAPRSDAATVLTGCGPIASSGDYVISKSLTQAGTCFTVQADNVNIDLQGHTLKGDGTGTGITDGGTAHASIVVTHGTITNFTTGIDLSASSPVTLTKLKVMHSLGDGIDIASLSVISDSSSTYNGGNGISSAGGSNTVTGTVVDKNNAYGMTLDGGSNVLTHVTADKNAVGINIDGGSNTLTSTAGSNNVGIGIDINGGSNSLASITASKNGGIGIDINGGSNRIGSTTASHNGGVGIDINGGADTVASSTASNNGDAGLDISAGGNTVSSSTASKNGGVGIDIDGSGSTLTTVKASGNLSTGIFLSCPSTVVSLTALKNLSGNLTEDTSDGTCTNFSNNAL